MELGEKIIESATEIFSSMVMMEITVQGDLLTTIPPLTDCISGVIGLAGKSKGVLAIHVPNTVAMAITGSFLGMDVDEMNEDVDDAVGELANMLGGDLKSALSENGKDIDLGLPSIISGRLYDFQPTKETERIIVPFSCPSGEFSIEVQIER